MKPNDLKKKLKKGGVCFMLTTPFDENGEIMLDAYRDNIKFLLSKMEGFDECTITVGGSNGELAHLSEEELKKLIEICVETVAGKATVIAGTGRASTYETIKLCKFAESAGVDGIQVILPYYFIPTEEGMYEHYKAVVEAVNIGVIVYNNPAFAGSWVNPKLMKKMIDDFGGDGKIASVKENTPHLMLFNSMVKELKDTGVSIHSGFGEQWYAYQFPWGADGLATPFGNFYPEYPINIYKAAKKYDFEEMRKELEKMEPYYEFVARCSAKRKDTGILGKPGGAIYGEGNVRFGVIKEAMRIVGLNGGYMRKPLTNLEDSEREELKEVLKGIGIV